MRIAKKLVKTAAVFAPSVAVTAQAAMERYTVSTAECAWNVRWMRAASVKTVSCVMIAPSSAKTAEWGAKTVCRSVKYAVRYAITATATASVRTAAFVCTALPDCGATTVTIAADATICASDADTVRIVL